MPKKIAIGTPAEETELFSSEAWQNATPEKRRAFTAKIRANNKIARELAKKQERSNKLPVTALQAPTKRTLSQRKKAVRKAKAERKRQRVELANKLGIKVKETRHQTKLPSQQVAGVDVTTTEFLSTYEWRKTRMVALKKYGARCQCCGATPATGAVINVDHIKPRKLFPHLALDVDNLQVLCHECNHGKGNWDQTDWRKKP